MKHESGSASAQQALIDLPPRLVHWAQTTVAHACFAGSAGSLKGQQDEGGWLHICNSELTGLEKIGAKGKLLDLVGLEGQKFSRQPILRWDGAEEEEEIQEREGWKSCHFGCGGLELGWRNFQPEGCDRYGNR
jgi:hypothetical protein